MAICPHCQITGREFLSPCPSGDGYFCIEDDAFLAHSGDPLLGQQIAGRFIVVNAIGHGSMGYVYKAIQGQVDRPVALKVYRPNYLSSSNGGPQNAQTRAMAQQRFVQEARVLGKLSHPNCVTLYDFGVSDKGDFLYIAMEYVGGFSLRRAVRRGLKLKPIIEITRQVLLALSEAHSLNIVHRDLKPENIMLAHRASTDEQVVKVLDFGIAKLLGQNSEAFGTSAGLLFGTPAYMSPEQCRGETERIGAEADIYALGCMLYEMVCGQLPYPSNVAQEMVRMHLDAPIPALTARPALDVPLALELFIKKCMAKQPEQRYPNAKVALLAFDEAVGNSVASSISRSGLRHAETGETGSRKVVVPQNRISGTDVGPLNAVERLSVPEQVNDASDLDTVNKTGERESQRVVQHDSGVLLQQSAVATVFASELEAVNLTPASTSIATARDRSERGRTITLLIALMMVFVICMMVFYYIYQLVVD